jgi:hypothetical protein
MKFIMFYKTRTRGMAQEADGLARVRPGITSKYCQKREGEAEVRN